MHYLTRRFAFSASHRLCSGALSAEEQEAAYGLCQNIHGHNYRLEITVRGEVDPKTGFFGNVMDLKALVDERVANPCEHQFLNELPMFEDIITTMEGLSSRIWQLLERPLADCGMELYEILLAETDDNIVRLRKD
ncbi:MAG: 6-carboxytetrahydropterin synthase [Planctomycetota bacterium]|jgi:6-pyruvoyltetrahydropterin/6-carboxytetrahydropterin synthase|nr:6-carboxytetrahydropterin synthase [Planctomycetota bacterium]